MTNGSAKDRKKTDEADDAVLAIRSLLQGEDQPATTALRAEAVRPTPVPRDTAAQQPPARDAAIQPDDAPVAPAHDPRFPPIPPADDGPVQTAPRAGGFLTRRIERIKAWRPTRRQIIWAAVILFVWLRPGLVFGTLFVLTAIGLLAYVGFGPEKSQAAIARVYHAYLRRFPERGERLRRRLDRIATRVDGLLDRLPDSWTSGLYTPDFSAPEERDNDENGPDPFDRLGGQVKNG